MARYANLCGNDENQAEGLNDAPTRTNPVHFNRNNRNNSGRNPHYENIYESIDQFATVNAAVPADEQQNNNHNNNNNNNQSLTGAANRLNIRGRNQLQRNAYSYCRNGAYDIPRQAVRSNNYYNYGTNNRRLNIDANVNRVRYMNTNRSGRQRSFDDTESFHHSHGNNGRYENIYEQIHEEPFNRNNNSMNRTNNSTNRMHGRLIHGIGRIERHLSSSCGNLERLNLGGTYAIMGHSHLGTVGHIRLNAANGSNNTKEVGKSLNLFSCLGRENSQSMSNIYRDSPAGTQPQAESVSNETNERGPQNDNAGKHTGAIPKIRNPTMATQNDMVPMHTTTLNRIPKTSLQWLLMNKWLPLWYYGDGSECNVLDFNFMFSRNCEGCIQDSMRRQHKRTSTEDVNDLYNYERYGQIPSHWHINHNTNDNDTFQFGDPEHFQRTRRINAFANQPHRLNGRETVSFDENSLSRSFQRIQPQADGENPFRRWELNSENNSFRPAVVRRITDGTFPNNNTQTVRVDINHSVNSNSSAANCEPSTSTREMSQQARSDDKDLGRGAACSSTESSSETENKIFSPDLSARRYSENTEDDQYNTSESQSTITDGEDSDENSFDSQTNSAIDSAKKSD